MGCAPSKKAHDDQAEEAQDEVPALPSDLPHTHNDIPLNDVQDIRAGKLRGNASVRSTGSARSLQRTGSESSQSRDAEIPARRANSEAFVHSDRSVKMGKAHTVSSLNDTDSHLKKQSSSLRTTRSLSALKSTGSKKLLRSDSKKKGETYIAKHSYRPDLQGGISSRKDIPFMAGDKLLVLDKTSKPDWWLATNELGEIGYVPSNFLLPYTNIEDFDWFHGSISRALAEMALMGQTSGVYLVRESETVSGSYSLSVRVDINVKHFLIRTLPSSGEYFVKKNDHFHTVDELCSYYETHDGLGCRLTHPCPRLPTTTTTSTTTGAESELAGLFIILPRAHVVLHQEIGKGQFGEVYQGILNGKIQVAIKTLKNDDRTSRDEFLREAAVMGRLQHPNLLSLCGVVTDGSPLLLVTEFVTHGALLDILRQNGDNLDRQTKCRMACDVVQGLAHMAKEHFVHRDLAARNIFVSSDLSCKIGDFGLATFTGSANMQSSTGLSPLWHGSQKKTGLPIRWSAPEVLIHNIFTPEGDVWSFGILLIEMFTNGALPYPQFSNSEVLDQVVAGYRIPQPERMPTNIYNIARACWHANSKTRPVPQLILQELRTAAS